MSKAKIVALILEFIVCILPGLVVFWMALFGARFTVGFTALIVFVFGVGAMAMVLTAKDME